MSEGIPESLIPANSIDSWFHSAEQALYAQARYNLRRFADLPDRDTAFRFFQRGEETQHLAISLASDIEVVGLTHAKAHIGEEKRIAVGPADYLRIHVSEEQNRLWLGFCELPPNKDMLIVQNVSLPLSTRKVDPDSMNSSDQTGETSVKYYPTHEGKAAQAEYLKVVHNLVCLLIDATEPDATQELRAA